MSSVNSRQALVGGGLNSSGSAAGAPLPAGVYAIIDNVAAKGDGNRNCILFDGDGATIDKISVGTSGTALAIQTIINLIAVE